MTATDYETSIFINDCLELSVGGVLEPEQVEAAFWPAAADLKVALLQFFTEEEIRAKFYATVYPGLCATLLHHGLVVIKRPTRS